MKTCKWVGCNREVSARGFCSGHYIADRYRSKPELRQKIKERSRERYQNDPEYRATMLAKMKKGRDENRERTRARKRRETTGFTPEAFDRCWRLQDGKCAICTRVLPDKWKAHADHTVVDGQKVPRGVLCHHCNPSLGHYESGQRVVGLIIEPYEKYLIAYPMLLIEWTPHTVRSRLVEGVAYRDHVKTE